MFKMDNLRLKITWCERDKDDDFDGPRRRNERRRSRSPLRRDKMGAGDSTPHFLVSPDPLTDHSFWASTPMSPPLRYDDPMSLEASLLVDPAVGPRYSPDSSGDDPISPGPGIQPQTSGEPQMGSTKNVGGGLTPAPQPQASFEDLRLGQDLYEGSAQLDGGLPAADDDQQADGQTAVEFCSRLFKELPPPLLPTLESPPPRATLPHTRKPRKRKTLQATRSSLRLAAKPSAVPVAERAQRKLMRVDFKPNHCSKSLISPLNLHANQHLHCFSPPLSRIVHPPLSLTIATKI